MTAPLLTAQQAGELLGVPPTWVLAEARADRIPHCRLGRYVRFDADDLEQWCRARMRGPVANLHRGTRVRGEDPRRPPAVSMSAAGVGDGLEPER